MRSAKPPVNARLDPFGVGELVRVPHLTITPVWGGCGFPKDGGRFGTAQAITKGRFRLFDILTKSKRRAFRRYGNGCDVDVVTVWNECNGRKIAVSKHYLARRKGKAIAAIYEDPLAAIAAALR